MICFHHNDADGRCAAAIVRMAVEKFDQERQWYREMDYGRDPDFSEVNEGEAVLIVDFSFTPPVMKRLLERTGNVVWLDHHKTAASYDYGRELGGIRDFTEPGHSGAMLTWMHLFPNTLAPEAVRLVDDWDTWKHVTDGRSEAFVMGLSMEADHGPLWPGWASLLNAGDQSWLPGGVTEIVERGKAAMRWRTQFAADFCRQYGFEAELAGTVGYVVNLYRLGAKAFGELIKKYPWVAACVFDGRRWTVSLYSVRRGEEQRFDCGALCKKFGGGGHTGAAGFVTEVWPFRRLPLGELPTDRKERALMLAAQAWCTPATRMKEIDPELVKAFAEILLNCAPTMSAAKVDKAAQFVGAKQVIKRTFAADPDFRRVYVDNVACMLMDTMPALQADKAKRDALASEIIRIVCE